MREAGAAADVRAQTHPHAVAFHLRQIEQAAAEEQVGRGAEGHGRAGLAEAFAFVITEVDAVGEDRARADQTVMVVDVQVTLTLGEQLLDPLHFLLVLGNVRVHVQVGVFGKQLSGQRQLFWRAGRGETRRHGVMQTAFAMPAFDQRFAVGIAGLGRVSEKVRRIAVHQHLTGDHPQVELLRRLEEGIHRLLVHRAEHQCGGGAVAQQLAEEQIGLLASMLHVTETPFVGEGVGFQPVQQLRAIGADDADLRVMNVGVDETGSDQRVRVFDHLGAGFQGWKQVSSTADLSNLSILDNQQAVFEILVRLLDTHLARIGEAVEQGGTVGFCLGHGESRNRCVEDIRRCGRPH